MGDDVVWFWESSWVFGPGALFLWDGWQSVRSVFWECEVEFSCGEPGGGVPSALRWMCCVCGGGCWSFCVIFKFIFGGFWIIIVVKVCWFGFEGGLLGAAWVLEESGLYV